MSKDNKSARQLLESIYGKGCMFKRAHISERLLQSGLKIKGYKVFLKEKRYKPKKIRRLEDTMTYHHLQHQADGGETTLENGAVVNELAHRYLHSLPRDHEEVINDMLREFKKEFEIQGGILIPTEHGLEVKQPYQIQLNFNLDEKDCITIPVYDDKRDKERKFNRAKIKQETIHIIEEALSELDDDFEL